MASINCAIRYFLIFAFIGFFVHEVRAYMYDATVKRVIQGPEVGDYSCARFGGGLHTILIEPHQAVDGKKRVLTGITSDGNCLFRAIAYCLFNDQSRYAEVRQKVVSMVTYNWDSHFKDHARAEYGDCGVYTADDYRNHMGRDGTWGGGIEVQAASFQFDKNFHVYKNVEDYMTVGELNEPFFALYFWSKNKHYDVVEDEWA